jgi:hypothetical protein
MSGLGRLQQRGGHCFGVPVFECGVAPAAFGDQAAVVGRLDLQPQHVDACGVCRALPQRTGRGHCLDDAAGALQEFLPAGCAVMQGTQAGPAVMAVS